MFIELAGARAHLLAEHALYLPDEEVLLVADVHLGKAVAFRRQGVPVPQGTTSATLARLDRALAATAARRVIFLGDLIHAERSRAPGTWAAVAAWRARHPTLSLTLVRGNHDRHAGDPPPDWRIHCVDEPMPLGPLALAHHPQPRPGSYVLAGHRHPAVVVGGRARDRLRLPCFHFGAEVGVLPAFGAFTGMHVIDRAAGDRVYAIAGDEVRALPG